MKKIYSIILILLISYPSFAQNGTGFNYQAVIRDAGGNIKANQSLSMEITILQGSVDGTSVFTETHQVVSNTQGIINLIIGSANPASFALINWANGPYFIQISIDGVEFGTSQLNSVPYALHSKTVENYTETDPLFSASPLKDITQADIEEWSKKIDSITEVDPLFAASASASITEADISSWMNKLSEFVETDPIFSASIAKGITSQDTAYWNSKFNELIEADPIFAASVAKGISGIDTSYWNGKLDEFIESDPLFAAHPTSSITEDDITTWKYLWFWYVANGNSFLKIASPAGGITASDTARWNSSANAGLPNTIADADGNTKVQVEETANDNKIRFDINGTERWVMDSTRLEPRNTGGSVFIGENAGLKDDLSANNNTFIGFEAGKENTTGENNTANGYQTLSSNTTGLFNTANGGYALKNNIGGNYNTANGYYSLFSNSNGSRNTANGYYAIYSNTLGISNTANGFIALYSNTTGNNNTAYGSAALFTNTNGNNNTANGYEALFSNTTGSGNVALGFQAGYNETSSNKLYIDNSNTTKPLIYGDFSADSLLINGMLIVDSTLKIKGGSPGVGKVLTSDANGLASWASAPVASGVLAFAGFYALMPPDNATTVALGAAIEFPQDGPSSGTITRLSPDQFNLSDIGVYMVNWQVSINEPGQLALELDGIQIDYTVVGRATGTSQITGISLIATTTINSVLRVINPAGNSTALTVTPLAGGTYSVSASLVITRIQ